MKKKPLTKEQFEKLKPRKQRVYLAQDVLEQLRIRKFVATTGVFIEELDYDDYTRGAKLKKAIPLSSSAKKVLEKFESCHVCAKGALVCSYVLNFNEKIVGDIQNSNIYDNRELKNIFGEFLWNFIEALFEGNTVYVFANSADPDEYPIVLGDNEERMYNDSGRAYSMESVMKNIIRNNGQLNYNGLLIGS